MNALSAPMTRPITIVISALGGQGGGVLTNWLVSLAEQCNYFAQSTSVPGVAQRTGATIYYLEIFPKNQIKKHDSPPIMALMPQAGDVDLVVAAELMEAGRALQREFVTPNKTTLITSTHRVYSVSEKMAKGDGRGDNDTVLRSSLKAAQKFIAFDMEALAADVGCVISSILFGAIAGSGLLPFTKEEFENAIRTEGKMVPINLKGFDAGYQAATENIITHIPKPPAEKTGPIVGNANTPAGQEVLKRINQLPPAARNFAYLGAKNLLEYQDLDYVDHYITTLEKFALLPNSSEELIKELSRYLALWMGFDDVIKIADLKTRATRVENYRREVKAKESQIVHMVEFMHPRLEEIIGLMPAGFARRVQKSKILSKFFSLFTGAKKYNSTKIIPYLMLYMLGSLKKIRRKSLRYAEEHAMITDWLNHIETACETDHDLALEIIKCQQIIKGYGNTHTRGRDHFNNIMHSLNHKKQTATEVKKMHHTALMLQKGE